MKNLTTFERAYLETALWSSIDESNESGDPLDKNFAIGDIDVKTIESMKNDCDSFIKQAGSLLDNIDDAQAGHDFWLTRNHHGAGFWDRGLGDIGDQLTDLAHSFGEVNLFVNNGKIVS